MLVIELAGDNDYGSSEIVAIEQVGGEAVAATVTLTFLSIEMNLHENSNLLNSLYSRTPPTIRLGRMLFGAKIYCRQMKINPLVATVGLLAVSFLGLSGCGDSSPKTSTMVLTQPAPTHHVEDFGHGVADVGDLNTFEAPISENGSEVGWLTGERVLTEAQSDVAWALEHRVPGADGVQIRNASVWHQTMTFHFHDRGTIEVEGDRLLLIDAADSAIPAMTKAAQQPLAIIGGTGDFLFARGQVVSQRNEDGTYTQTLTYRLS